MAVQRRRRWNACLDVGYLGHGRGVGQQLQRPCADELGTAGKGAVRIILHKWIARVAAPRGNLDHWRSTSSNFGAANGSAANGSAANIDAGPTSAANCDTRHAPHYYQPFTLRFVDSAAVGKLLYRLCLQADERRETAASGERWTPTGRSGIGRRWESLRR